MWLHLPDMLFSFRVSFSFRLVIGNGGDNFLFPQATLSRENAGLGS